MAAPKLPDAKVVQIAELKAQGLSNSAIAKKLRIDRSTVTRYVEGLHAETAADESTPSVITTPVDPVDDAIAKAAKRRDLVNERDLLKAVAGERSFRVFLEDLMREVAPLLAPIPAQPLPGPSSEASQETLMLILSDWHAFEEVSADRTMGFNEFTGPILCERIKRLIVSSLSVKQRLEKGNGWRFPNLRVACNGDFISGTIHELERHSDAANVVHAAYSTGMLLALALRDLAPHFKRIDVNCTSGNHGRLPDARKVQQKDPTRSWDTFIYLYAMTALRDTPNVHWHIPDSYFSMYEVENHTFLQTHGHDIKSWNSIPYYGIDRFGRNVQALFNSRSERIDYFVISHFHSAGGVPAAGGETFVNGSIIGGTEFSIGALGKCDKPSQWLLTVHPEHGVVSRWPILANTSRKVDPYPLPMWPASSPDP